MNPLELYVLLTIETAGTQAGHRTYLFADERSATLMGEFLKAGKPREVDSFVFVVVPLEGTPA